MKAAIKRFIARLFRIKTKVYTLQDREFTPEALKILGDFLNTPVGRQLCDYLTNEKFVIASSSARKFNDAKLWQGYAIGFEDAINSILIFRQPDANGNNSESSSEVTLEDYAQKIDQE